MKSGKQVLPKSWAPESQTHNIKHLLGAPRDVYDIFQFFTDYFKLKSSGREVKRCLEIVENYRII